MSENEKTADHCCKTVECGDLSAEYINSLKETVMHLHANQLVCDQSKSRIAHNIAHLLIVYAASFESETLTVSDLRKLHKNVILFMPQKMADAFINWREMNER